MLLQRESNWACSSRIRKFPRLHGLLNDQHHLEVSNMNKFGKITAALVMMASVCTAQANEDDIRKMIAENTPQVKIESISKLPYGGLYQVVTSGFNIFYTDEKGEIGFFGNMIDLKTRVNLTQQEKEKISVVDFSKLPLDKSIVKVKGNGSRKLALFSDPECPYCQLMEKQLEGVTDVTIYTFLLPLKELHPDSERKAQLIWCAKDRAQAWDDMLLLQKEPTGSNTKCDTPLKDIADVAARLSITGTPGVIFGNGKLMFGAVEQKNIETLLSQAAIKP